MKLIDSSLCFNITFLYSLFFFYYKLMNKKDRILLIHYFYTWTIICVSSTKRSTLTRISCVHYELGYLEGASLHQAFAEHFHLAGVSDLWLPHHDFKGAVSHMFAVLLYAHHMLTHFLRSEGDPWGEKREKTSSQADYQWRVQFQ